MDSLIATARSNKVAATLAVQDFSQLKKDYGTEQADVITGIVGNIISGQVTGDTTKKLSENFEKIMQDRESTSINSSDTSTSWSTQLDYAIPAAKIASLSSGEFVGIVADNPEQKINLKMFHSEVQNDHGAIAKEEAGYKPIPVIEKVSATDVEENYERINAEMERLLKSECEKIEARRPEEGEAKMEEATPAETGAKGNGISKRMQNNRRPRQMKSRSGRRTRSTPKEQDQQQGMSM